MIAYNVYLYIAALGVNGRICRGQGRALPVRQDVRHAAWPVGSCELRQPRTEAEGKASKQVRRHAQLRVSTTYAAFAEVRKAGRHFCRCVAPGPFV